MSNPRVAEPAEAVKSNMDSIYDRPDPRAYFRELGRLGYSIPDLAKPIFRKLADRIAAARNRPVETLDLGCSYGINGALLKHDLSMHELRAHWASPDLTSASTEQVIAADRAFLNERPADPALTVIGLDASEPAIAYAEEAGLIDRGYAINLEEVPLPDAMARELASVDLVQSTGCIGYVTERTFDALLPAVTAGDSPWMAHFVLRMFPFDAIEATLDEWGYVTEKLDGQSFIQREFTDLDEQRRVVGAVEALGLDPAGMEADGALHAEFYLSRPRDQAGVRVDELLMAA